MAADVRLHRMRLVARTADASEVASDLQLAHALIVIFTLERIVLRLAGAPIDDALDELPPAEVAAELETANVKV